MYEVDELDTVVELHNVPQSDVGAPLPLVLSDEHNLFLAYLVSEPDPKWDGSYVTMVGAKTEGVVVAIVRFHGAYAHMFGPPNDEAFGGHPLAERGLEPYAAFEIKKSSWIRRLERMNSIHHYHQAKYFEKYRHFIFAFHDTTFECVADGFQVEVFRGSLRSALDRMTGLLADEWS